MLWVASVNGLGHADCFSDAHPFLKYAEKMIQVQTSCLRLVPWMLKARPFVLRESRALGGRCMFIVFGGLFGITEGI